MNQTMTELESKIHEILTDLERVRENLLTLSDDIWLNIDHNDNRAMEEGVYFKRQYNEKVLVFDELMSDLSKFVQDFTSIPVETDFIEEQDSCNHEANERVIRELDRNIPHSLDEDFRYKRPYGIVFRGKAYKDIVTWNKVYYIICRELIDGNPERFKQTTNSPLFVSNRGNRDFSDKKEDLRKAMKLVEGVYAEANLSANSIRDRIKQLLIAFNINTDDFSIYLREDSTTARF